MPQYGRPSADTYNSDGWTDQAAGGSNLYTTIDETSFSDADYIQSALTPTSDAYVTKLTNLTDPVSSANHVVRFRRGTSVTSGGEQIDLTVQLRQGYTNEGSPGTLIAQVARTNINGAFADDSFTLSGAEADAITDYTSLYLRFLANKP